MTAATLAEALAATGMRIVNRPDADPLTSSPTVADAADVVLATYRNVTLGLVDLRPRLVRDGFAVGVMGGQS